MLRITSQIVVVCMLGFMTLGCNVAPLSEPYEGTTYLKSDRYYCEIHDLPLRTDTVPIIYGWLRPDVQWAQDVRMTAFPNSDTHVEGGCTLMPDSLDWQRVWYCPVCRKAEKAWTKSHPEFDEAKRWPPQAARNLPDGPMEQAAVALGQNDQDVIAAVLERLMMEMQKSDAPTSEQAVEGFVRIVHKLDAGWPGYCGPIIAIKNKQPIHSRPEDLGDWARQNLRMRIELYPHQAAFGKAYDQVRPPSVTATDY